MRPMSVKEVQEVSLEILKRLDAFCRERGIRYFLDSGTLLGAARHKGFIPWDDDADVVMPRPDYERFVKEFPDSGEYKLFSPSRGNCFVPYSRLCEMRRTYFKQESLWTYEAPGVGVDVIPMDGAPDDPEEFDRTVERIKKPRAVLWRIRYCISPISSPRFRKRPFGFAKDVVHFLKWAWDRASFSRLLRRSMDEIRRIRLLRDYEKCDRCYYIAVTVGRGKYWRREWFDKSVEMDFCGCTFLAPAGYDERLTAEYGDWRTPPSKADRMTHERDQKMMWRE